MSATHAQPLFRASPGAGFAAVLADDPRSVAAVKIARSLQVEFVAERRDVETPEGPVRAFPGDAIVSDADGARWPVPRARFAALYQPAPPTVAGSPGSYLTMPLRVLALRMDEPFQVLLPDGLSRLTGRRGDWLVGTADGSLYVISAAAFDRSYRIDGPAAA
jgi:hypothetical protein